MDCWTLEPETGRLKFRQGRESLFSGLTSWPESEPIVELKNKQGSTSWPESEPKDELKNKQGVWLIPNSASSHRVTCKICQGNHCASACRLSKRCPLDQRVGEGCFVRCACGTKVIDGKCPKNCGNTWGQATISYDFQGHFGCKIK